MSRFLLIAVFAIAAWSKVRHRNAFAEGLGGFGIGAHRASFVAPLVIAAEAAIAMALAIGPTIRLGAIGAVVLLGAFTAIVVTTVLRGMRPACNCFGARSEPIGWGTVARNLALAALASLVAVRIESANRPATLTDGIAMGIIVVVATFGLLLWNIVRLQGRILIRLEALERREAGGESSPALEALERGLPVGSLAPDLMPPEQRVETGRPVLAVFVRSLCGPCRALEPQLNDWQRAYGDVFTIVREERRELAEAYRAFGTPAAVVIQAGRIASPLAQGADEIRALVAGMLDGPPQVTLPALTLATVDGSAVSLLDAIDSRVSETVLLLWNPACGFCAAMFEDLRAWSAQAAESTRKLLIVSPVAFPEANDLWATLLIDPNMRLASSIGALGTPMAVRIDARGIVAADMAAGREAVLAMLQREALTS